MRARSQLSSKLRPVAKAAITKSAVMQAMSMAVCPHETRWYDQQKTVHRIVFVGLRQFALLGCMFTKCSHHVKRFVPLVFQLMH